MDDNKDKPEQGVNTAENSSEVKKSFGKLKPLTAIQIISLIVPSSPVGAGACY